MEVRRLEVRQKKRVKHRKGKNIVTERDDGRKETHCGAVGSLIDHEKHNSVITLRVPLALKLLLLPEQL